MGTHRRTPRASSRTRRRLALALLVIGLAGLSAAAGMAAHGPRQAGSLPTPSTGRPVSVDPRLHRTADLPDDVPRTGPVTQPSDDPIDRTPTRLRVGDRGPAVVELQRRLDDLGYPVRSLDGVFGDETLHSLVAFQKVNGLSRDGIVGPATRAALANPTVLRPRGAGTRFRVEIDLAHQVLYLVAGGRITEIYDVSTGSGQTYVQDGVAHLAHTPTGSFAIERKIDALHESPLGLLYRPAYFVGGYAIHGSSSVPAYPASHGCVRVTDGVMDQLFDRLVLGTPVLVF